MRIARLDESHDRAGFTCGVASLDLWFHDHALVAERQDTARTFVLLGDDDRVLGYHALTIGSVERTRAPLASFPAD